MKKLPKSVFKQPPTQAEIEAAAVQDYLDHIAPSVIKFYPDYFICGNTYRCVWAIREYPATTEEQAILRYLGDKDGVTLHIYSRHVPPNEQRKILQNATRRNKLAFGSTDDIQTTVEAEENLRDVAELLAEMRKNREPLIYCAVFIEMIASDIDRLKNLQVDVQMELLRSKINHDRLMLQQKEGFASVIPSGKRSFGVQFERALPASSVANLFPMNYSGLTDPTGFYIGRDRYGSNVIVDFNARSDDKTNANILVLGNSGQGKSYLLKLIICNLRESGMGIVCLDPESEYEELTENLGGCYIDLMDGKYIINLLQPKAWSDGEYEETDPESFRESGILNQHIAFLKDFFRSYKDFEDRHIDTLEIMIRQLYKEFGITERTNLSLLSAEDFPILSDLYNHMEHEFDEYDTGRRQLYTQETLQELCLGLHSICIGTESMYFNGHTNISDHKFITFGVKGLLETNQNLRNAMLANILSYMSNVLLTKGNTAAVIDELYIFLSNITIIEYIRNFSKRVRKRDSSVILASQNLEDFDLSDIREYTKPLFAIPTHSFLFNAGSTDSRFYIDTLQLEQSEFDCIKYPERGRCLYRCGNDRYLLEVRAPEYKEALFGKGGGR